MQRNDFMVYWDQAPMSRKQIVLFAPMLDSVISENHPVRLFDEILGGYDWTIWEAEYNGRRGRPPIPPRVMAGTILYGLTRGVRSSRHLEYLIGHNLDFIWLVEGRRIDHSTICGFRTRFREQLKDLFKHLGRMALTMGVARLNEVALDGTRVKANNGRSETLTAEGIEARLSALDEELERMLQEAEAADREDQKLFDTGESCEQLPPELADLKTRQKLLQDALEKAQGADKTRRSAGIDPEKNPAQVPTTDSDSRVLPNKEGGYAPNYTPIATPEVYGGFILDADVIASTSEHLVTIPSMDRLQDNFGEYPDAALADGAHATGSNMAAMEERGIDFYSPMATTPRCVKIRPSPSRNPRRMACRGILKQRNSTSRLSSMTKRRTCGIAPKERRSNTRKRSRESTRRVIARISRSIGAPSVQVVPGRRTAARKRPSEVDRCRGTSMRSVGRSSRRRCLNRSPERFTGGGFMPRRPPSVSSNGS